jgi:hypothetical protein
VSWYLASFIPVALAVSLVLAATAHADTKAALRAGLKGFAVLVVVWTVLAVLVTIAQDPWIVLGRG